MPNEAILAISLALGINGLVWGLMWWRINVLKRKLLLSFEMQGERLLAGPVFGMVSIRKGIGRSNYLAVIAVSDRRLLAVTTFGNVTNVMREELSEWQFRPAQKGRKSALVRTNEDGSATWIQFPSQGAIAEGVTALSQLHR